jgi:hypothetical protein
MKTLGDLWSVLVVQSGYAPQIEEKNDAKPFCSPFSPFVGPGVSEEASESARAFSGDRGPAESKSRRRNQSFRISSVAADNALYRRALSPPCYFCSLLIRFPDRYTI